MIEGFDVKDQALGTGDTLSYTFDFKIYDPTDLLIWVQDGGGNIVEKVRGDDTSYLASVTFDPLNGGGTVTLAAFLPDTYTMTMMLAPDAPDQPTSFPNKWSFSFEVLEGALDFLASQIQRVAYLAQRAMVLHDLDDVTAFDPTLPLGIGSKPGGIVSVKSDGSGFECVVGTANIAAAQSGMYVYGSATSPLNILAAGGITPHGFPQETQFVQGNGGAVILSGSPQIAPGTAVGQMLYLIGANNTQTVQMASGAGTVLGGTRTLAQNSILGLFWTGVNWVEMFFKA